MPKPNALQLSCNTRINYSEVAGQKILPFIFELDQTASVLNPGPGENQRFCYNVTGVGEDKPNFADLSHFVLGICNQIPQSQIVNLSVVIDGVEQEVDFGEGGNVELKTSANPDPPTGCTGLKFDFSLDKVIGEMSFCFELTEPYPVGPNPVCLYGGGVTATGLTICGPVCEEPSDCSTVAYQPLSVCVPVTITPLAVPGPISVVCCGDPVITPGKSICGGTENGKCYFTITQNLCVSIPVVFGAAADVGDPSVQCGTPTPEDVCTDCVEANSTDSVMERLTQLTKAFIREKYSY